MLLEFTIGELQKWDWEAGWGDFPGVFGAGSDKPSLQGRIYGVPGKNTPARFHFKFALDDVLFATIGLFYGLRGIVQDGS